MTSIELLTTGANPGSRAPRFSESRSFVRPLTALTTKSPCQLFESAFERLGSMPCDQR